MLTFMFPCSGKDPTMQVKDLLSKLKDSNFQTVWLDIEENPSQDVAGACKAMKAIVNL